MLTVEGILVGVHALIGNSHRLKDILLLAAVGRADCHADIVRLADAIADICDTLLHDFLSYVGRDDHELVAACTIDLTQVFAL